MGEMAESERFILQKLRVARRRLALTEAVASLRLCLPLGLGLCVAGWTIAWLIGLPPTPLNLLPLGLPSIVFLYKLLRSIPLDETARRLDSFFDLEERLSTAYELVEGRIESSLKELMLRDASEQLSRVDLRKLKPSLPKPALISLIFLPALALLWLLPQRLPSPEEK
ncbi:hypothetical protein DRP77_01070, partial [Candidatus Poribacteria bacterium]